MLVDTGAESLVHKSVHGLEKHYSISMLIVIYKVKAPRFFAILNLLIVWVPLTGLFLTDLLVNIRCLKMTHRTGKQKNNIYTEQILISL